MENRHFSILRCKEPFIENWCPILKTKEANCPIILIDFLTLSHTHTQKTLRTMQLKKENQNWFYPLPFFHYRSIPHFYSSYRLTKKNSHKKKKEDNKEYATKKRAPKLLIINKKEPKLILPSPVPWSINLTFLTREKKNSPSFP